MLLVMGVPRFENTSGFLCIPLFPEKPLNAAKTQNALPSALNAALVLGQSKSRMPSSTLIPFLEGLGSLINPFKQKRAPFLSLGYWAA